MSQQETGIELNEKELAALRRVYSVIGEVGYVARDRGGEAEYRRTPGRYATARQGERTISLGEMTGV